MIEEWRPIPNYEDLYLVSNLGRVRSLDRKMRSKKIYWRIKKGKVLKACKHLDGYCVVRLCRDAVQIDYGIHRLVALAFLDNKENKLEVNHKNGNREDNRLVNLEWVTPKENMYHSCHILRNGRHTAAKLTIEEVKQIIKLYLNGMSAIEIAQMFNVTQGSIRRIYNRQTWKHVLFEDR